MRIKTGAERIVSQMRTVYGWSADIGIYALASVYNSLAAMGARCLGMEAVITIPSRISGTETSSKADGVPKVKEFQPKPKTVGGMAHEIENALRKVCGQQDIELKGVEVLQNSMFLVPAVSISGIGRASLDEPWCQESGQAGDEIVLVKWIGMEGMLRAAQEKDEELRRRFAPVFIRQIHAFKKDLFAGEELTIAKKAGVTAVRQITEGGIFAALWNLAKEAGCGLELDLKRMSVLQETIEVCEHYRLNPYQLTSAGSFLMLTEDGKRLTDVLRAGQIEASVIGKMTEGNDKVIHNGEDVRYLDRPSPDDIFKIWL